MQSHSQLAAQTEDGLDGWHVSAPEENLLFYTKKPEIQVPVTAGHQAATRGLQEQETVTTIPQIPRDSWNDTMQSAHEKVL